MTPDKRLDQAEPVLADVAQKTDRLIESNGQILDVAIRADSNAEIAARGIADLTFKVNQLTKGQIELTQKIDQLAGEQAKLRQEMKQGFEETNQKFEHVSQTQQQILTFLLDRLK